MGDVLEVQAKPVHERLPLTRDELATVLRADGAFDALAGGGGEAQRLRLVWLPGPGAWDTWGSLIGGEGRALVGVWRLEPDGRWRELGATWASDCIASGCARIVWVLANEEPGRLRVEYAWGRAHDDHVCHESAVTLDARRTPSGWSVRREGEWVVDF